MADEGATAGHEGIEHFDVIVIGAGSTGTNVAGYARDNDLTVAIVEDHLVGGECSYYACIPSKALLGPPNALAAARRLAGADAAASGAIDAAAVLARRDEFISDLDDDGQADWVSSVGAELVRGKGRLAGQRRVDVEGADGKTRHLEAARGVVIASGSRPAVPPIDGLADAKAWTNREATTASQIPARLAVLGGGVVGCEMAQAYRRLGAEVTIVEASERILSNYDAWVSEILASAFDDDGITMLVGAKATEVRRDGDGSVVVTLDSGDTVEADELLVATGRTFNTDDLGLETVGLEAGGPLATDDLLRVADVDGEWLYAAGDVNGRALLTHQGKYQARCVGDTLAGRAVTASADHGAVPQVVFTDPEVAAVGVSCEEAESDNGLRTVSVEIASVAGTKMTGQTRGRAALVIDDARNVVVGATLVGPDVGEVLHSATVAIVGEVPVDKLWHCVPAFPTVSEVWLRLLEADRGVNT